MFDNGANPDRANADWSNVRQELSAVVYVRAAPRGPLPGRQRGAPTLHPSPGACRDVGWAAATPGPSFSPGWSLVLEMGVSLAGDQRFGVQRPPEDDCHHPWDEC